MLTEDPTEETTNAAVNDLIHCSFCGKSQKEVSLLLAGPNVQICDECIEICQKVILDQYRQLFKKSQIGGKT